MNSQPELRRNIAHVIPDKLRRLPRDRRGYPVPYFVAWIDGKPDHRVVDPHRFVICVRSRRCWICGGALGKFATFVVGPMCIVNKTSGEPPSHPDCAKFAVQACPFMLLPNAQRRTAQLPEATTVHPDMLLHNPGAMVLWTTDQWAVEYTQPPVVNFGEPKRVSFWFEGRTATRGEVLDAFAKGLPALKAAADEDGGDAPQQLARRVNDAMFWLPDAA